jgi:hypothetical protein
MSRWWCIRQTVFVFFSLRSVGLRWAREPAARSLTLVAPWPGLAWPGLVWESTVAQLSLVVVECVCRVHVRCSGMDERTAGHHHHQQIIGRNGVRVLVGALALLQGSVAPGFYFRVRTGGRLARGMWGRFPPWRKLQSSGVKFLFDLGNNWVGIISSIKSEDIVVNSFSRASLKELMD